MELPRNHFKHALAAGRQQLGLWSSLSSNYTVEVIAGAGYDWILLDTEHSPNDLESILTQLQAAAPYPTAAVVRVAWNDTVNVKRVLDAGAHSLLFPFIQNGEEARKAVAATRYPPEGVRGMAGMSRASRFGTVPDFFKTANKSVCAVLQLETPEAIASLEQIAAVPGVGGLFVGPGDLSGAMGHVGNLTHPAVMDLMADAARRARTIGMPIGTVGGTPEVVAQYRAIGYDFVAVASDLGLLMRAAQAAAQALRAIDGAAPAAASRSHSGY